VRALAALAALALLSGCGGLAVARPESHMLVCREEPGRPVGTGPSYVDQNGIARNEITDEENGKYLRDLRNAGEDCRERVRYLNDWFSKLKG
jgi:hypothetical protein